MMDIVVRYEGHRHAQTLISDRVYTISDNSFIQVHYELYYYTTQFCFNIFTRYKNVLFNYFIHDGQLWLVCLGTRKQEDGTVLSYYCVFTSNSREVKALSRCMIWERNGALSTESWIFKRMFTLYSNPLDDTSYSMFLKMI